MKKKMSRVAKFVGMSVCVLSLMSGCGSKAQQTNASTVSIDLLDQVKEKGVLVVGTASGYPPYEFVDAASPNQEVIGVDMAFAKVIADKIGVELKIENMTFSALLSSIPAKKIDIAIAGICPTDERRKTIDFSEVYINAEQKILIRNEDKDQLKTLDDFVGKKVGVQKSTTQETLANAEIKDVTIVSLDKVPDLILELLNGKIDGIVVESVVAQQYIIANPTLGFSDATFKNSLKPTAVALDKGNDKILEVINQVIKEKQESGEFDKWIQEYSQKAIDNTK